MYLYNHKPATIEVIFCDIIVDFINELDVLCLERIFDEQYKFLDVENILV